MQKRFRKIICSVSIAATILTYLSGCSKPGFSSTATTGTPVSYFNIMNLAPYGYQSAVFFGGNEYQTLFPIGSFSTSYFNVASGSFNIQFKTVPGDSIYAQLPTAAYDSSAFYTLLVYNDSPNTAPKLVALNDNYSTVTNTSLSYYRFFNMSPDQPAVDLYMDGVKIEQNRTPADNVNNSIYNSFQTFATGYHTWQVTLAGTKTNIAGGSVSGSTAGGQAYTMFLEELSTSAGITYSLEVVQASAQ